MVIKARRKVVLLLQKLKARDSNPWALQHRLMARDRWAKIIFRSHKVNRCSNSHLQISSSMILMLWDNKEDITIMLKWHKV